MSLPNDPLALPIHAKVSSSINALCDTVLPSLPAIVGLWLGWESCRPKYISNEYEQWAM